MTRSEVILQSPEFAIYRKEGSISDLQEKVNVSQVFTGYKTLPGTSVAYVCSKFLALFHKCFDSKLQSIAVKGMDL